MSPEKLVHMANQIGNFFVGQDEATAVASIADHLRRFWDPRMRSQIIALVDAGGDGLSEPVRRAVQALRSTQ